MYNIAAALGLEHDHPIISKLWGHGDHTNTQTDISDEVWNVNISPKLTHKNYKEGNFR